MEGPLNAIQGRQRAHEMIILKNTTGGAEKALKSNVFIISGRGRWRGEALCPDVIFIRTLIFEASMKTVQTVLLQPTHT